MICEVGKEIVIRNPTKDMVSRLAHALTFANPEYIKKERMGLWTGNTPRTICLMWRRGDEVGIPFGMLPYIRDRRFLFDKIIDKVSREFQPFDYKSNITPYDYQEEALKAARKEKSGIIVAPCGSGKTQIGLEIAARIGGRALWLTHTGELLNQSMDRARSVYGLSASDYGTITAGKVDIGKVITFATVQTMYKMDLSTVENTFDTVIVDEAHHCVGSPAKVQMFWKVISALRARYKFGLTATPTRADGMIGCMFALLGTKVYEVTREQVAANLCPVSVHFLDTGYVPNIDYVLEGDGTLIYSALITDLTNNAMRNRQIISDIRRIGGRSLVLTERVDHARLLHEWLTEEGTNASLLIGNANKKARAEAIDGMNNGQTDVIVATYALAKEGLDIPCLDNVFMTTPKKDEVTVTQSSGRVARKFKGKKMGNVYDYVDCFGMLVGWARKRRSVYKKCSYHIAQDTAL